MTLQILLSPESEAKLRERAAAEGKDVAAFVRETIEQKLAVGPENGSACMAHRQGTAEWFAKFNEWIAIHPSRRFLAADCRDAIYGEEPGYAQVASAVVPKPESHSR